MTRVIFLMNGDYCRCQFTMKNAFLSIQYQTRWLKPSKKKMQRQPGKFHQHWHKFRSRLCANVIYNQLYPWSELNWQQLSQADQNYRCKRKNQTNKKRSSSKKKTFCSWAQLKSLLSMIIKRTVMFQKRVWLLMICRISRMWVMWSK